MSSNRAGAPLRLNRSTTASLIWCTGSDGKPGNATDGIATSAESSRIRPGIRPATFSATRTRSLGDGGVEFMAAPTDLRGRSGRQYIRRASGLLRRTDPAAGAVQSVGSTAMDIPFADIRTVLDARLPDYPIQVTTVLGEGLDNVAYEVNGELVLRVGKNPDPVARQVRAAREAALLAAVAPFAPLPIPEPAFATDGMLAYRTMPG